MTAACVQAALGRPEHNIPIAEPLERLERERILITGAEGSIGTALGDTLACVNPAMLETDICGDACRMDVRSREQTRHVIARFKPTVIFHLAGAKHAPHGEDDPFAVCDTNVWGTKNVLNAWLPAKVVLASTCKAANPETAYGASKLIAERAVLNRGGSVARFYNVVESSGNVFQLWRGLPETEPLDVAPCVRYFITLREAVALLLWTAVLPQGRFAVDPVQARSMRSVATALYPGRAIQWIYPRRGDRREEPLAARHEDVGPVEGGLPLLQIVSPHDPVPGRTLAVAA